MIILSTLFELDRW